jgi:hypothetical protein
LVAAMLATRSVILDVVCATVSLALIIAAFILALQ